VLEAVGLIALGLAILAVGGDLLVRGAVAIARLAGLTPAVIGLTVVALGTSLPELVVSVIASIGGQPDLAMGNVIGSNLINTSFILGLTALVIPLPITGNLVKMEWPVMFGAMVIAMIWSRDLVISRPEAAVMLVMLVLVMVNAIRLSRAEVSAQEQAQFSQEVDELSLRARRGESLLAVALTAAGVVMLVLGGKWLVAGSVDLARLFGMSERVIGLTIVAGGTSAPEVATSLAAALKKRSDIAIANLIGSNIFNTLGILGAAGAITPLHVSPQILGSDMWWMIGSALLLFLLMWLRKALSRPDGAVLLGVYVAYIALLIRSRG
jgi:cation:H+ antiporter